MPSNRKFAIRYACLFSHSNMLWANVFLNWNAMNFNFSVRNISLCIRSCVVRFFSKKCDEFSFFREKHIFIHSVVCCSIFSKKCDEFSFFREKHIFIHSVVCWIFYEKCDVFVFFHPRCIFRIMICMRYEAFLKFPFPFSHFPVTFPNPFQPIFPPRTHSKNFSLKFSLR